ncbi:hypothetical protein BDK51DRAFT_48940 [Blyttiomyces helicus]|uniref:Uncharacterized protein n=1 Tax=Blyttiomyces helicus TaxID=388810 RepID=A0A4P9W0G6_9FUNG|nr:hypothetical protein BDK51DRAFT_48940 [Blyttiomyces helicus]|eukprot:RKO84168.1 hypothetical protein BDK51DRAFT_48940 [Blyttiomyces helicus]
MWHALITAVSENRSSLPVCFVAAIEWESLAMFMDSTEQDVMRHEYSPPSLKTAIALVNDLNIVPAPNAEHHNNLAALNGIANEILDRMASKTKDYRTVLVPRLKDDLRIASCAFDVYREIRGLMDNRWLVGQSKARKGSGATLSSKLQMTKETGGHAELWFDGQGAGREDCWGRSWRAPELLRLGRVFAGHRAGPSQPGRRARLVQTTPRASSQNAPSTLSALPAAPLCSRLWMVDPPLSP